MLLSLDVAPLPTRAAGVTVIDGDGRVLRRLSGFVPYGGIPLSDLRLGCVGYQLRRPVEGVFVCAHDRTSEFWVEGFSPTFVGHGKTTDDAFADWKEQVHERIQELMGKRPFEMTPGEEKEWSILESLIDVVGYQNQTPVAVRQLGQVSQARPHPRQVTWADGSKDVVQLDLMPPEFAAFKPGQWFEAVVERDPSTGELVAVRYTKRTASLNGLSQQELDAFWESLPTTSELEPSTTDWSHR